MRTPTISEIQPHREPVGRDTFVDDAIERYAKISGSPQVFMFYQMDVRLAA